MAHSQTKPPTVEVSVPVAPPKDADLLRHLELQLRPEEAQKLRGIREALKGRFEWLHRYERPVYRDADVIRWMLEKLPNELFDEQSTE